ncbi:MAG: DUF2125 domain-containing protein [Rhodobacteraceae bacterium]|nr:DUF2125 domain-containing protein [Paracoccaceae bacterium]
MKNLYLTTALALIASPTLADITPEELWQSWLEIGEMGMTLSTGQQERQGNVLVLQDVKYELDFALFNFAQTFAEMRLEALPDGSVSVTYDSNFTGSVSFSIAGGYSQSTTFIGQIENGSGLAVGSADDYIYEFSIGLMHQTSTGNMGVTGDDVNTSMTSIMDIKDMTGQMHITRDIAGLNLTYTVNMGELSNIQNALTTPAHGQAEIKQVLRMQTLGLTGEVVAFIPYSGALEGLSVSAVTGVQSSSISQKITSARVNMDMEIEQGPGTFTFLFDDQNFGLTINRQNASFTVASSQFGPQPYSAQIANSHFALTLPHHPSDTPQNASIALSFGGVTVSDSIWAFADPENTLSRTPADFEIAADFNATLLLDWANIEAVKAWEGMPAILHNITLESFLVGFENARIEGEGTVDFSTETDVPEPNGGTLSFTLTGIPALLEKLGGLPLVGPATIAQANGMLGMFTSAGEGGALVSEVEFGEGGFISVNGLQVK